MRNRILMLGLLAGAAVVATPAAAAIVTFTGTSQTVYDPETGDAETYVVSFSFDDAIAPIADYSAVTFNAPFVTYRAAYYENLVAFSITGPRYSVSFDSGAARVSTLDSSRFRDGNAGLNVSAGSDSTYAGYHFDFNYLPGTAFGSTAMPTTIDFASAVEGSFNLSTFFEVSDPDDPDAEPFIDSRELLNFRFASGGIVPAAAVPEPATWAMLIGGFGMAGTAMRRRRARTTVSFA